MTPVQKAICKMPATVLAGLIALSMQGPASASPFLTFESQTFDSFPFGQFSLFENFTPPDNLIETRVRVQGSFMNTASIEAQVVNPDNFGFASVEGVSVRHRIAVQLFADVGVTTPLAIVTDSFTDFSVRPLADCTFEPGGLSSPCATQFTFEESFDLSFVLDKDDLLQAFLDSGLGPENWANVVGVTLETQMTAGQTVALNAEILHSSMFVSNISGTMTVQHVHVVPLPAAHAFMLIALGFLSLLGVRRWAREAPAR